MTQKASGVGARRSFIFELNDDGVPLPESASAVPYEGEEVEGIKTFSITEGAARRIAHLGEDIVMATQTMPTQENDTLNITTGKSNMSLDAVLSGTLVRTYTNLIMRVGGGSMRGDEPYVMTMSYQQAVDTDKTSPTFGRLTRWRGYLVPVVQIVEQPQGMDANLVDKTYQGILPVFFELPWLEALDDANWGKEQGNYVELHSAHEPYINTYRGDGDRTMFLLSKSPVDDEHLIVWVEDNDGVGQIVVPDTVVTGNVPSFTLAVEPGIDRLVLAFIQTNRPNQRVIYGSVPAAPTLSSPADAATVADLTPDLTWVAVTGATSYRVQIATTPFTPILQDVVVNAPTVTYTATTLIDGTTYYWRVRAINQYGESAWSTPRSFLVDVP